MYGHIWPVEHRFWSNFVLIVRDLTGACLHYDGHSTSEEAFEAPDGGDGGGFGETDDYVEVQGPCSVAKQLIVVSNRLEC